MQFNQNYFTSRANQLHVSAKIYSHYQTDYENKKKNSHTLDHELKNKQQKGTRSLRNKIVYIKRQGMYVQT
jgi:hypothetical protein